MVTGSEQAENTPSWIYGGRASIDLLNEVEPGLAEDLRTWYDTYLGPHESPDAPENEPFEFGVQRTQTGFKISYASEQRVNDGHMLSSGRDIDSTLAASDVFEKRGSIATGTGVVFLVKKQ